MFIFSATLVWQINSKQDHWMVGPLNGRTIEWQNHWMAGPLNDRIIEWQDHWMALHFSRKCIWFSSFSYRGECNADFKVAWHHHDDVKITTVPEISLFTLFLMLFYISLLLYFKSKWFTSSKFLVDFLTPMVSGDSCRSLGDLQRAIMKWVLNINLRSLECLVLSIPQ